MIEMLLKEIIGYDEKFGKILCANSIHCCWPIHKTFEEKTGGKFTTVFSLKKNLQLKQFVGGVTRQKLDT